MAIRSCIRWFCVGAISVGLATAASSVTMDWTAVGNPGNACESHLQGCLGAVGYSYWIGTYEVTNTQYAEFLNAKAASDPLALYSESMGTDGQIARSGNPGSYTYSVGSGRESFPANFVSYFDALRFVNWLNNGQGNGDTESGSYLLLGGTATPSNATSVTRSAGATIVLPNENEWYKAAFYDALSASYFDYPTSANSPPTCSTPTATPNSANCDAAMQSSDYYAVDVGSYPGSASPYGTFDQGGNVAEWMDELSGTSSRFLRGGGALSSPTDLAASHIRAFTSSGSQGFAIGFRVAEIPEPGTGLLLASGLIGLVRRRRVRA